MNIWSKIGLGILVAGILAGGAVLGVRGYKHYRDKDNESINTPGTPGVPNNPADVTNGNNVFLWKPSSGTRGGRCGILTPANLNVKTVTVNGEAALENAGRCPDAGDYRYAFFLSKSGAAYGVNITVRAIGFNGSVLRTWVIPNGAARFQQ